MIAGLRRVAAGVAAGVLLGASLISPARADAVRDTQWQLDYLRVAEANRITTGAGVVVAVLDEGVDPAQPELSGSVLPGVDWWSSGRDGHTDPEKHGTGMAMLIAGHGRGPGGADGIRGVAPGARILPVGVVFPAGFTGPYSEHEAEAFRWAVSHGAQVISISAGGAFNQETEIAIHEAYLAGVPVVASGGNRSQDTVMPYPGSDPWALGISAVGQDGNFAADVSVSDARMDFAAPGVAIESVVPGGAYGVRTGTSNSAALAAGVVALIRARYPALTPQQIYDRLKATAVDKGAPGHDSQYGWGVIDPVAALTREIPGQVPVSSPTPTPTPTPTAVAGAKHDSDHTTAVPIFVVSLAGAVLLLTGVLIGRRRRFTGALRRRHASSGGSQPS